MTFDKSHSICYSFRLATISFKSEIQWNFIYLNFLFCPTIDLINLNSALSGLLFWPRTPSFFHIAASPFPLYAVLGSRTQISLETSWRSKSFICKPSCCRFLIPVFRFLPGLSSPLDSNARWFSSSHLTLLSDWSVALGPFCKHV